MENSYTLINNETGEIVNENFGFETLEDRERKKKSAIKAKDFEEYKELQKKKMGNFIFFLYKSLNKLKKVLNDNELVRYIMLATYIKKNKYLMNDNNTYITRKQMQEILIMGDTAFKKFYKIVIENKLIIKEEKHFKINTKYFWRGKIKFYEEENNKEMIDYTRIYVNATRELYKSNYKKLKKLAVAYKLIPYINWKYNILCSNIKETDTSKINLLNIRDVMNITGYDEKHMSRFKDNFYGIKFYGYNLFGVFQKTKDFKDSRIIVNPLFTYRNKEVKDLEYLFMLFDIKID